MKTITEEKLFDKVKKRFKTEQDFKNWWVKQRKKHISQGYPEKDIMKLPIDYHTIIHYFTKTLKLEDIEIIESEDYPIPSRDIEYYVRRYRLIYK